MSRNRVREATKGSRRACLQDAELSESVLGVIDTIMSSGSENLRVESWFVYMVECSDGSLYSGITNNVAERLKEHNLGWGPKYTKKRRPVRLVYSEEHPDHSSARTREAQLKRWRREKKEALIEGFPRLRSG